MSHSLVSNNAPKKQVVYDKKNMQASRSKVGVTRTPT